MDPRLKFEYYENNKWENYYIRQAKDIITNVWETKYKNTNTTDADQSSDNLEDEFLLHLYKKKKFEGKDELKSYLKEPTVSLKTNVLLWWKVNFIINYIYFLIL